MIVNAAVKIFDKKQNKEIIIPCHRHCDAYFILKSFGYKSNIDYYTMSQGFLDEKGSYYNRVEAWYHAYDCHQITETECKYNLFSEDLW